MNAIINQMNKEIALGNMMKELNALVAEINKFSTAAKLQLHTATDGETRFFWLMLNGKIMRETTSGDEMMAALREINDKLWGSNTENNETEFWGEE